MSIRADSRPELDMGPWIMEKSGNTLRAACRLVDQCRENAAVLALGQADREWLTLYLEEIIRGATFLASFGSDFSVSSEELWIAAMHREGSVRFDDFQRRLAGEQLASLPLDGPPMALHRASELVSRALSAFCDGSLTRTEVRSAVLDAGHLLMRDKYDPLRPVGARLIELVDRVAVAVDLPWDDFNQAGIMALEEARDLVEQRWAELQRHWSE